MLEAKPWLVPRGGLDNSLFQSSLENNLQGAGLKVWGLFQGGGGGKDLERRGGGLGGHLGGSTPGVGCSLGFLTQGRGFREAGVCTGMCAYERVCNVAAGRPGAERRLSQSNG